MTRLGTILRRQMRPIRDTDRFSLTPSGQAALEAASKPAEAPLSVRQAYDEPADGQPKPEWVRGDCPMCGAPVVANSYHIGGRGYTVFHECWKSLGENPSCTYRKSL